MKVNEEKIDDFLLDRMSKTDRQAFEQELEKDGELASRLKVQEEVMGGLALVGKEQFKARLQRIKKETFAESNTQEVAKTGRPAWFWWLVGVMVVSLALLFFWMLNKGGGEDPNVIYADMFEVYDVPLVQRDTDDQQFIQQLSTYYKDGAYGEFIEGFTDRSREFGDHPELQLSLGISYLQTNQALEAAAVLTQLEESNYPAYHDHARWYRILAALQQGDVQKAKELLPPLLDNKEADHHIEAKELARRL
ncbi:MAG: hypothetical protein KTR30_25840 [Saprospiraceae bacterium]|nr:hypothetical protein [Saprospiraceae bacterium]